MEDNVCMLERIIEMSKVREDSMFVAFIDMDKAYDRENSELSPLLFNLYVRELGMIVDSMIVA